MAKKKPVSKSVKKEPAAPTVRRAVLALRPAAFIAMFSGRHEYEVGENPLPANAVVVDARVNRENGSIEVLIEHPTIPETAEGGSYPFIKPPIFHPIAKPTPKRKPAKKR